MIAGSEQQTAIIIHYRAQMCARQNRPLEAWARLLPLLFFSLSLSSLPALLEEPRQSERAFFPLSLSPSTNSRCAPFAIDSAFARPALWAPFVTLPAGVL